MLGHKHDTISIEGQPSDPAHRMSSEISKTSQDITPDEEKQQPLNNEDDSPSPLQGAAIMVSLTNTSEFVPPYMSTWQRRLTILSLCATLFLSALDITIISTALPTIAKELSISSQQYAWISSALTLSSTASTPVWAKLSDVFGRKYSIIACAAIFMVGSLICALANTGDILLVGRVIQGSGAGGSTVLVTIIIGDLFAMADRAKYYGLTGVVYGVASAVGPVLGGVFSQTIGWRWCFYINLPFDGVAIVILFFALKVDVPLEPILEALRALDWAGFALIIGGTITFLYGLQLGSSGMAPWSSVSVICLIIFGALLLFMFMLWESRFAQNPIIPGRIFHRTTNVASFTLSCLHSFTFISYDFFLPLYTQVILGLSPLISGLTLFALIVPLSVMPMFGALVIRRTGNYVVIVYIGVCLMALGSGLFISFTDRMEWAKLITFQVIAGLGAGLLFQSPMIALQSYLHQKDVAAAMSAYSFLRSLSTSVSVVIGTMLIQQSVKGGNLMSLHDNDGDRPESTLSSAKDDYMKGLHTMWTFYTAVCGLMILAACFIKQKPISKTEK